MRKFLVAAMAAFVMVGGGEAGAADDNSTDLAGFGRLQCSDVVNLALKYKDANSTIASYAEGFATAMNMQAKERSKDLKLFLESDEKIISEIFLSRCRNAPKSPFLMVVLAVYLGLPDFIQIPAVAAQPDKK